MPVINYEGGVLSLQQKEQLIKEFTEVFTKVVGMPKETLYIFLKENSYDNVGVGGQTISKLLKDKDKQ
ncbi:MAG: tautomerase family protein [Clostridiales bacterium]|jgi:4-oxalocrotonate tautomerase|nr:tautomerase family protein [Clostridiales bacterium]